MLIAMTDSRAYDNTKSHGPCANCIHDVTEFDFAFCFYSLCWSPLTDGWRKRCSLDNWPPNYVLEDIIKHGCHLVPVGSKIANYEDELEWRMSFSLAEQKLVYSMNHTQFLCYGLLKIFLQEVVNRDIEEPFLCSYFVKTTLFWLIQIGHITWYPNGLLNYFWKCLKFLLESVYRCVLSNFFVPQNNMFASKLATVEGVRQSSPFQKR